MEEAGVSFDDSDAFNLFGKIYAFGFRRVLKNLTENLERQDVITALEQMFEALHYKLAVKYHEEFLQLLNHDRSHRASFIYFGAHTGPEPLLYLASLPQILKNRIKEADGVNVPVKLLGTDMFAKFAPEAIFKYIIPVVLRDSPGQRIICSRKFLHRRLQNRKPINNSAISTAADYLLNGGENLIIFPQGLIKRRNVRWKTGIIRILGEIMRSGAERAENIFLVPVRCPDIAINSLLCQRLRGYLPGRKISEIKIDYGKPIQSAKFMTDFPTHEADLESVKRWMNGKAGKLQMDYERYAPCKKL